MVRLRSKKKTIAIFGYKQWLLSLNMKTKVVQKCQIFKFSIFEPTHYVVMFMSSFLSPDVPMSRSQNHGGCAILSVCKSENEVAG